MSTSGKDLSTNRASKIYMHISVFLGALMYNTIGHKVNSLNANLLTRDVRQRQRVSTAMAVLTEWERPLHPFPLQLPLISNPQPFPPRTVAVLAKNSTVFNSNGTVFT